MNQPCKCKRLIITMLLIVAAMAQFTAKAGAKVSIEVTNAPIEQVLKEIGRQADCKFSFKSDLLNSFPAVTISCQNQPLEHVLDKIFENTALTYKIISSRSIIITERADVSKRKAKKDVATKTISGTIIDDLDEPVIGASVTVKGSQIGVSTDIDGRYTLSDVPEGATVSISYVGLKPVMFKVGAKDVYDFKLEENREMLNEMVVVGYGTQKKANLTGAVATLSQDAVKDRPIDNLGRALQGMIPNLNVTISSGQPAPERRSTYEAPHLPTAAARLCLSTAWNRRSTASTPTTSSRYRC